jgi:aminopeptidase YwaD
MKKIPIRLNSYQKYFQPKHANPLDSLITSIIQEINPDTIRYYIQSLQDFGTRFLLASNRDSVSSWIYKQFINMGYNDVAFGEFNYSGTVQRNVIATLNGSVNPQQVYVLGGHHDSYSSGDRMVTAPGADDNASGTAAVLEIARILSKKGYIPEVTIKFATFAAEEYGLFGGYDFAQKARASNMDIRLMFNHDMISNLNTVQGDMDFSINRYTGFDYIADVVFRIAKKYTKLNPVYGSYNSGGSDSYPFWQYGYPAVYSEETDFSPYYHSPNDLITNCNMEYCAEISKVTCATILTLSVIPSDIKNLIVSDVGNGHALQIKWSANIDLDLQGYKVYVGTSPGVYDTSYTTIATQFYLTNLDEGVKYYIGVSAFDYDGYESFITEISGTPHSVPLSPANLSSSAGWHSVTLGWEKNKELDLFGYNVFKSAVKESGYVKINNDIVIDTVYIDPDAVTGNYFYYIVTAVDSANNESDYSNITRSRGVSLQYGILVVDETSDGDGSLMKPTDAQVDGFYNEILQGFDVKHFDVANEGRVYLSDLGAYSTVIWHGNDDVDFSVPKLSAQDVRKYLQYGGNLLITCYKPSNSFMTNTSYPRDFTAGDFLYDCLKIKRVDLKALSRLIGAKAIDPNYPSLYVDTTKTFSNMNYHIPNIEALYAVDTVGNIYAYDTYYDSTKLPGILKGRPVGVEYSGQDFKVVTLSFPLYYMQQENSRQFIQHVLIDKFNEVLTVSDRSIGVAEEFYLSYNYPFNSTTNIKYGLPKDARVKISIYNLLGQEVATLVDEDKKQGAYEVRWDGKNKSEILVSSGIYICKFIFNDNSISKKILLVK